MIGLCDCNNFFASCERVFRPDLNGKPVVVLSNNDGCIIARSNEAKSLGIKMGMPLFQAKPIVDRYNVAVFSSNYQLYGDMSSRVMSILRANSTAIEVYSIDEAFIDFSSMDLESLQQYGRNLSKLVRQHTSIPVSIGIAPTKTLAKIASKLCKQYPKLEGACLMYRSEDIEKVLQRFPLDDVWGIGRRSFAKLSRVGVSTAWDFYMLNPNFVQREMGVTGLRTWQELHATKAIFLEEGVKDKQQIGVSRSFSKELTNFADLHAAVSTFVALAAEKLRSQRGAATEMGVYILTNRFREDVPQRSECHIITLDNPSASTIELTQFATRALKIIFKSGFAYKKAGVFISKIVPDSSIQKNLFVESDTLKHNSLMRVVDGLNSSFGRTTISLASQGDIAAFSSRKLVSNRFTTCWGEILEVK